MRLGFRARGSCYGSSVLRQAPVASAASLFERRSPRGVARKEPRLLPRHQQLLQPCGRFAGCSIRRASAAALSKGPAWEQSRGVGGHPWFGKRPVPQSLLNGRR